MEDTYHAITTHRKAKNAPSREHFPLRFVMLQTLAPEYMVQLFRAEYLDDESAPLWTVHWLVGCLFVYNPEMK